LAYCATPKPNAPLETSRQHEATKNMKKVHAETRSCPAHRNRKTRRPKSEVFRNPFPVSDFRFLTSVAHSAAPPRLRVSFLCDLRGFVVCDCVIYSRYHLGG